MKRLSAPDDGFTLIEMSIVLVIIGLIVGGVLVGQDLIHNAQLRATIRQVEQLDTAVNAFKLKYNGLPGDLNDDEANAIGLITSQGFGVPSIGHNGNDNGQIDYAALGSNSEDLNALAHLKQTQFLPDPLITGFQGEPELPVKLTTSDVYGGRGTWAIEYNNGSGANNLTSEAGNYFMMSNYDDLIYAGKSNVGVIQPVDAFAIDTKMDDGLPASGKVRATSNISGLRVDSAGGTTDVYITLQDGVDTGPAGANSNFCVTDAPYTYNVLNISRTSGSLCAMMVKASF